MRFDSGLEMWFRSGLGPGLDLELVWVWVWG